MDKIFYDLIDEGIDSNSELISLRNDIKKKLAAGEITPYKAATDFFSSFKNNI